MASETRDIAGVLMEQTEKITNNANTIMHNVAAMGPSDNSNPTTNITNPSQIRRASLEFIDDAAEVNTSKRQHNSTQKPASTKWSLEIKALIAYYLPTKANLSSQAAELKATFLTSKPSFSKPKPRYRVLACHHSRHHPMFWPNRKKDIFEYVTVKTKDTEEDMLTRGYPITWPEECSLLQTWHVDKYINRCWRKDDKWKLVARLNPSCEQWQEFYRTKRRNYARTIVTGGKREKKSFVLPGQARHRGDIVLFVLEREGDGDGVETVDGVRDVRESILDEEPSLGLAREAVVVDGKELRVTVKEVREERCNWFGAICC